MGNNTKEKTNISNVDSLIVTTKPKSPPSGAFTILRDNNGDSNNKMKNNNDNNISPMNNGNIFSTISESFRRNNTYPTHCKLSFHITANDLATLAEERTYIALANLLAVYRKNVSSHNPGHNNNDDSNYNREREDSLNGNINFEDPESPSCLNQGHDHIDLLISKLRSSSSSSVTDNNSITITAAAEQAASALISILLHSHPTKGITNNPIDIENRIKYFGNNALQEKEMISFLRLCWEALHDFVLVMLICLGVVSIVVEATIGVNSSNNSNSSNSSSKGGEFNERDDDNKCGVSCWLEGAAILMSVCIVMFVTASIDHAKQYAFRRLSRTLDESNVKTVIRDGTILSDKTDSDIVVGDIVSLNSHILANVPADGILLGPSSGTLLEMDESTLTGESGTVGKRPGDVLLSGTTVISGVGRMVVIAVGIKSVAGKIRARVYEQKVENTATTRSSDDSENDDEVGSHSSSSDNDLDGNDEEGPLFTKLTKLAKQIGFFGIVAAVVAFTVSTGIGLGYNKEPTKEIVEYFIVAVTVLAVAVPEGLPLAVTLSLAFSSNKMMKEQNLVKHLDACETMGCATTICTDKTGTLTNNKMTARAIYTCLTDYICNDPSQTLGQYILNHAERLDTTIIQLLSTLISINTMNESALHLDDNDSVSGSNNVSSTTGNPTEVALLHLVHDLGGNYRKLRDMTRGRSETDELSEYLKEGRQMPFSSSRKMMSWIVPTGNGSGSRRLYCKGASEIVLGRCVSELTDGGGTTVDGGAKDGTKVTLMDATSRNAIITVSESYARRGMRCLALAYRDLSPEDGEYNPDALDPIVKNPDGSNAYVVETNLTFCALVGIEDPLRPEVPGAIEKCYRAGIDVRLVTGDSPNTAVSIAYQAGILRDSHFDHDSNISLDEEGGVLDDVIDVHVSSCISGSKPEMIAANLKPNVLMEGKDFRMKVYRTVGKTKEFDQTAFDEIWPYLRVLARSSPDDKLTLAHGLNQSTLYMNKVAVARLRKEHGITIFPDRQVIAMTGDGTNDAPALKRADVGFAMGIAGTQIAKDAADIILLDDNFASIVTAAKWGRNVYASIQKFLQFQLTVNIAAVVTALVGAFAYQKSPLAAIQLLWVNLLMDSLASLALASEPPSDKLLEKPPVNRSEHMITRRMWANMIGQASYQIIVTMVLLFVAPDWFDIPKGHLEEKEGRNSVHYTLIFNSFVWMQLFNEINCRSLKGEFNVFKGLLKNSLFCVILLTTSTLQVIMVEYGSHAMHVAEDGLDGKYWAWSIGLGAVSLPVQQIINLLFSLSSKYKIQRKTKRLKRDASYLKLDLSRNE